MVGAAFLVLFAEADIFANLTMMRGRHRGNNFRVKDDLLTKGYLLRGKEVSIL